jgi:hypothetical protein
MSVICNADRYRPLSLRSISFLAASMYLCLVHQLTPLV